MSTLRIDFIGTSADDTLIGGGEASVMVGGAGNDLLVGGKGHDALAGEQGDDTLVGGEYAPGVTIAPLTEYTGEDWISIERPHPSSFSENLAGGEGEDVLIGGNWQDSNFDGQVDEAELGLGDASLEAQPGFNNSMWGGAGADTVYGANGFDTIGGGTGNDFLKGFGGVDLIYGGAGDDFIYGGDGDPQLFHRLDGVSSFTLTESLYGGDGDDHVWGEGGADMIFGGAGSDTLSGGADNDTIKGGADHDVIHGDEGDDILTGGAGADSFTFGEKDGYDVITDFNVTEDSLFFDDISNQLQVDEQVAHATETSLDGQSGLLLSMSGDISVFLVGLTVDDISSITAHAGPIFTGV